MADVSGIQRAYELRLRRLLDELTAEVGADEEQQRQLVMLHGLATAVVQAYGAHQTLRAERLDSSTSVMYAADAGGGGALNVPLGSLVENGSLSSWQARFLTASLGLKRTILITGPTGSGRSTLLNSLVQLITVDQRIVAIEGDEALPALRDRSFTVHIPAQTGTPSLADALEKGAAMQPTWVLVECLGGTDGPSFLRTLYAGFSGLATVDSPDPELVLSEWTTHNAQAALHLRKIVPLVVHMDRDPGGRPRALKVWEAGVNEKTGRLVLNEKRPD
ncbi:MAG TPA: ATPase, T2SS/T4P/T4SS family [Thermoleophilia bacterium]|nr:ATPase, T2SS/T4P/T4SS family [Thermoleophilia bacterium]